MGSSVKRRAPAGPTFTMNVCGAVPFEPSASVAVTVTVAVPSDIGVTITVLPDTDTAATPGADDAVPYVSESPSGSRPATRDKTPPSPPTGVEWGYSGVGPRQIAHVAHSLI